VIASASVDASPGLEYGDLAELSDGQAPVGVTCIDYGPGRAQLQEIADLENFLAGHRPEWSVVRWINVDGLSDMGVIHAVARKYELHP